MYEPCSKSAVCNASYCQDWSQKRKVLSRKRKLGLELFYLRHLVSCPTEHLFCNTLLILNNFLAHSGTASKSHNFFRLKWGVGLHQRKSRIFIPEIRHVRAMLRKRSLQCILMPRPDENQRGPGGHQPNNKVWPPLDAWKFHWKVMTMRLCNFYPVGYLQRKIRDHSNIT